MADLKADTGRIRECSQSLWQIYNAFTNHPNPLDGYDQAVLGDKDLTHVFSDFAGNWKLHRESLAGKIETLGQITQTAADSYDKADSALADALRKADQQYKSNGAE